MFLQSFRILLDPFHSASTVPHMHEFVSYPDLVERTHVLEALGGVVPALVARRAVASTAGVELTKHALQNSNPFLPQASWARPYEFLNAENFAKQGQEESI